MSGEKTKNFVEAILVLMKAEQGKLKVFLTRKGKEPYKGYWVLPSCYVKEDECIETSIRILAEEMYGFSHITYEQGSVFSDVNRMPQERVIGISYLGLIDSVTADLNRVDEKVECGWFAVDSLPKVAYDHEDMIENGILRLKQHDRMEILPTLFPSDFTLPEVQHVWETIEGERLDRRNFRKKLMQEERLEYTGYKAEGTNGRPAKLYRFQEQEKTV